jgi:hypothetical protein
MVSKKKKKKKNKYMEKSLLVIIGGKINRYYRTYKEKVKEKFKVRQVKPYVIEFPQRLTMEEIKGISD